MYDLIHSEIVALLDFDTVPSEALPFVQDFAHILTLIGIVFAFWGLIKLVIYMFMMPIRLLR